MSLDADAIVDRRRLRSRISFWRTLAILVAAAGVVFAILATGEERVGLGGHIARFSIEGFISGTKAELDTLEKIANAPRVKALIVRIDSPGGTTAGSEALYNALRKVAAKKPVVAVVGTLAASGGYVAALGTDRIVARRNAIVGSIGVLYQWPEIGDLLKNLGIDINEIKSSPLKAAPSIFEPPSPEARAVIEDLVRDSYGWFIGLVTERRSLAPDEAARIGDGRVFTGGQAVPLKLVDQIGGEEEAIAWLASARGIDARLPVRTWKPRGEIFGLDLGSRALGWTLRKVGLGMLADLLQPGATPLNRTGPLDGLLSLWQAPRAEQGTEAAKSAP